MEQMENKLVQDTVRPKSHAEASRWRRILSKRDEACAMRAMTNDDFVELM